MAPPTYTRFGLPDFLNDRDLPWMTARRMPRFEPQGFFGLPSFFAASSLQLPSFFGGGLPLPSFGGSTGLRLPSFAGSQGMQLPTRQPVAQPNAAPPNPTTHEAPVRPSAPPPQQSNPAPATSNWVMAGWGGAANNYGLPYGAAQWSGGPSHHRGADILPAGGSYGTPYGPFVGGTVTFAGPVAGDPAGNSIVVRDDAGRYHWYMHNSWVDSSMLGQRVEPGQVFARVGDSGSPGFAHVHYEVRSTMSTFDPGYRTFDPTQFMR